MKYVSRMSISQLARVLGKWEWKFVLAFEGLFSSSYKNMWTQYKKIKDKTTKWHPPLQPEKKNTEEVIREMNIWRKWE